jgi:Domain of unknown function (DUF4157)
MLTEKAHSHTKQSGGTPFTPVSRAVLQRKCACGTHTMGGGQCAECQKKNMGVGGRPLQTKLAISETGDAYEHEADRVAEQVMRMSSADMSKRQNGKMTPSLVQRRASGESTAGLAEAPPSVHAVLNSPGQSLEPALQQDMEQRFGHDFSQVRVHSDAAAGQSARDVNAHAYTVSHNIVFGAGRFAKGTNEGRRLIAHELMHVVQQTGHTANSVGETTEIRGPITSSSQVLQRKKVSTGLGEFETTRFNAHDSGVDIVLTFDPDEAEVDATKIALVQSVKATNEAKTAYAINPSIASRMVKKGKVGAGYAIDASGETNNPLYFDIKNLGATEELEDTPSPAGTSAVLGDNTHYQFGYCYKAHATDARKIKQSAGLSDRPEGLKRVRAGMMFETTALAIEGTDKDKFYGSVKWGYTIRGTAAAPSVAKTDIELASEDKGKNRGRPTANFIAPARLWNVGTTRGTLVVDPSSPHNRKNAYIENESDGTKGRLGKGTKLKQVEVIKGTTEGMIKAEVLNPDGTGTGRNVFIYVDDIKDMGDGTANKKLPQ